MDENDEFGKRMTMHKEQLKRGDTAGERRQCQVKKRKINHVKRYL